MSPSNIKMVWWNTALSSASSKAKEKGDEEKRLVLENIIRLVKDYGFDFVGVCEVSESDLEFITENIELPHIRIVPLTDEIGKTRFDMGVLYDSRKIVVNHEKVISAIHLRNTIKAAQYVKVINLHDGFLINVFLCHWSSKLVGTGEDKRILSANKLKNYTQELLEKEESVVIMGDFNDNPYNRSIFEELRATRCHDSVRAYPKELLYNPFWRNVVSSKKINHLTNEKEIFSSGTYKYKDIKGIMWHSYDQMLFSGELLSGKNWCMNEETTKVLEDVVFLKCFENKKCFIDHLPIYCELTKLKG